MSHKVFPRSLLALAASLCLAAPPLQAEVSAYVQRNLVSDGSIPAAHTDPNLVNPWGIATTPTGMVWVAGNGSSTSTVYDGRGDPMHSPPLVVDVPGGSPTGIVRNDGADFPMPGPEGTSVPSLFLFATEAGIISGWNYEADISNAVAVIDNSETGAVYKGIALAANGTQRFLYATDFHGAKVDVFDSNFQPARLPAGAFRDATLPPGFAPFGIQNINGSLYVTYARQDKEKTDSMAGAGQGFLNVFDADGRLIRRLVSRSHLNAPWGMALAPANFGPFSNQLLVGNFGDGRINAFNLSTGEFKGQLQTSDNRPIAIEGLWGICFGNGVKNQPTNTLFFTAGPGEANQGLYGRIDQAGGRLAARSRPAPPPQAVEMILGGAKPYKVPLQEVTEVPLADVAANEAGEGVKPRAAENRPVSPGVRKPARQAKAPADEAEAAGLDPHNPPSPEQDE